MDRKYIGLKNGGFVLAVALLGMSGCNSQGYSLSTFAGQPLSNPSSEKNSPVPGSPQQRPSIPVDLGHNSPPSVPVNPGPGPQGPVVTKPAPNPPVVVNPPAAPAPSLPNSGPAPTTVSGPSVPPPGVCGPAASAAAFQAPSTGLCSSGDPSVVSGPSGRGPFFWSCNNTYCQTPANETTVTCAAANGAFSFTAQSFSGQDVQGAAFNFNSGELSSSAPVISASATCGNGDCYAGIRGSGTLLVGAYGGGMSLNTPHELYNIRGNTGQSIKSGTDYACVAIDAGGLQLSSSSHYSHYEITGNGNDAFINSGSYNYFNVSSGSGNTTTINESGLYNVYNFPSGAGQFVVTDSGNYNTFYFPPGSTVTITSSSYYPHYSCPTSACSSVNPNSADCNNPCIADGKPHNYAQ